MTQTISNALLRVRDGFETADLANWDVIADPADIIDARGDSSGASFINISKCLCEDSLTLLLSKFTVTGASRSALGMSLSQRKTQELFKFMFVEVDRQGEPVKNVAQPAPVAIASASQSTTTMTVTTSTPHGLVPGDVVTLYGVADSRLNLSDCVVATVTSPTVYTITNLYDGTALTSLTASSNTGFSQKGDALNWYDNAFGIIWQGTTATQAKFASKSNRSPVLLTAQTTVTTTAPTVGNAGAFCDSQQQSADYDIRFKNEGIVVRTIPSDAVTAPVILCKRNRVIPDINKRYKILLMAKNPKAKSAPVADIVSMAKTASTTATVVTATPHGLTTGDYISLYGNYNQTNNVATATPAVVASVVDANTFTVVWGTSTTGTAYGGSVVKMTAQQNGNGSGAIVPAIQNVLIDSNFITLTTNVTLAGILNIADTVELKGLVSSVGADLTAYEGVFKIANVSTTTLTLYNKNLADKGYAKPALGSTAIGGAIFKRTDFRLHSLRVFNWERITVDVDAGNGNNDLQEALPVVVTTQLPGTSAVNVSQIAGQTAVSGGVNGSLSIGGNIAHDGAGASGLPVKVGATAVTANPTAVSASGDVVNVIANMVGVPIMLPYAIPESTWQYGSTTPKADTADTAVKAAAAAGIRNYVTSFQYQNTSAVATNIQIKDGSTVIFCMQAPATMLAPAVIDFPVPLRGTAATAINVACGTTSSSTLIAVQGFIAP